MTSSAPADPSLVRDALVAWYAKAKRDLPWRRTRDPYAIWLSEVMLQQTRVDTVVPYFHRFMERFPTVTALAEADLEEVLSEWSGLGYYRRARALHQAAAVVSAEHGGVLPSTRDGLLALPGIGPYTAGAIASIAFGERAAIVDGNVTRVLARMHAIEDDVSLGATKRHIWDLAEALVPDERPGDLNEALMELGATVCTPKTPVCHVCPVASHCQAKARGLAGELPRSKPKKKPRALGMVSVVARCGDGSQILLGRRPVQGLFGGLWEPPMVEADSVRRARRLLSQVGVSARAKLRDVGTLRHVLTHRVLDVRVHTAAPRRPWKVPAATGYEELAWRLPEDVPLSTLAKKILRLAAVVCALVVLSCPTLAWAQKSGSKKQEDAPSEDSDEVTEEELALYKRLNRERGAYGRLFFTLGGGKGIRFNNPFRLSDQLGDTPESLSATAGYFDLSMNATFGEPDGIQHGGALHFAIAVEGVGQQAFSASYLLLHRGRSPVMVYGRLGVSLLTAPDFNAGGELAFGLSYFFTGGIGLTSELVGNLFYGAGTYEAEVTAVPVLSLQGGVIFDFEVLP